MPNYEAPIIIADGGSGNLGSISDPLTNGGVGRYWTGKAYGDLRAPFVLGSVLVRFNGSGTGTAALTLYRQDKLASAFRTEILASEAARGIASATGDSDFWLRIPTRDERDLWYFQQDEELVIVWSNPGDIEWNLRIQAYPA